MGERLGMCLRHIAVNDIYAQKREQRILGLFRLFVAIPQSVIGPRMQLLLLRICVLNYLLYDLDRVVPLPPSAKLTAFPSVAESFWFCASGPSSDIASAASNC